MHFWHDIPIGKEVPELFNLVVEIPRDGSTKYELDLELGVLRVDRVLQPPLHYPANYGFIPQTLADDDDPLDGIVLMQDAITPLSILKVHPIGIVKLMDNDEKDDKIICVHPNDPMYRNYKSFEDLPEYEITRLEWFFNEYKDLMKDEAHVLEFQGAEAAKQAVKQCRKNYKNHFPEKQP